MWTKNINDDCFQDPAVCFMLMKASILSIKEFASLRRDSRYSQLFLPNTQEDDLLGNVMIYAHYADGHPPTRAIRTKLLEGLTFMGNSFQGPLMDFPVNKIVDRAAFYGVSDFVEDMLCRESRSRRADAAKTLLGRICGPARFSSSQCPYPTRRILECLIKMGNLPPRIICDVKDADTSVQVPETMGLFVGGRDSLKINIYEVSRFIESQLTIVDSFLKAGADHWDPRGPTNSLAYFPRNFVLPKEAIQEAVEKR